ncbi:MAG: DUF3502 domain-containing protein [Peptococcaceae bacterium]|nr:DUF3502 domain-containing protein [Peptococcaceae bacterium]
MVANQIQACNKIYLEFMPQLVTGTADPEVTLPKFIDKLKQVGIERIMSEMQSISV